MPDYTNVRTRVDAANRAAAVLPQLQQIYRQSQAVSAAITLYQASTDTLFNQAVDDIFSGAEKAELADMLANLQTLTAAWAANHSTLLEADTSV